MRTIFEIELKKNYYKSFDGGIAKKRQKVGVNTSRHAACCFATRLLGRFGGMLPWENLKSGAIWCVLEHILLQLSVS